MLALLQKRIRVWSSGLRLLLSQVSSLPSRVDTFSNLHSVSLDWVTENPAAVIARHARVSTKDPDKAEYLNLLKYCIREGHVSIFEQVCASFEILTSRSISAQIIRHRSFSFQETSQRYCNPLDVLGELGDSAPMFELRAKDPKNRQNSLSYDSDAVERQFRERILEAYDLCADLYEDMIEAGVARECARGILPMCTPTRLHMQGTLRSWLFYVGVRSAPGTQKEHKHISNQIGLKLKELMPDVIEAVIGAANSDSSLGLRGWSHIESL